MVPARIIGAAAIVVLAATAAHAALKISSEPTQHVKCSAGTCTANAAKAVLNVQDLAQMLSAGAVTVASGSVAKDIEIDAKLSWTATNGLTLDAYHSIAFNQPVEIMGAGALTIYTNDNGTDGDYRFFGKGHIKFWDVHSNLTINRHHYSLFNSLKTFQRALRNTDGSGKYFAQVNDWNMSGHVYGKSPVDKVFGGTFEGLGNTISHLTIHNSCQTGAQLWGFSGASNCQLKCEMCA